MLQDLTLSINRLDLGELTSVIPYLPRITGRLNGDYHILQDKNEHISVASDMAIQDMTYEGSPSPSFIRYTNSVLMLPMGEPS